MLFNPLFLIVNKKSREEGRKGGEGGGGEIPQSCRAKTTTDSVNEEQVNIATSTQQNIMYKFTHGMLAD